MVVGDIDTFFFGSRSRLSVFLGQRRLLFGLFIASMVGWVAAGWWICT